MWRMQYRTNRGYLQISASRFDSIQRKKEQTSIKALNLPLLMINSIIAPGHKSTSMVPEDHCQQQRRSVEPKLDASRYRTLETVGSREPYSKIEHDRSHPGFILLG